MLDSFRYPALLLLLLLIAMMLGVVLGRYTRPRYSHRHEPSSATAVPGSQVPGSPGASTTAVTSSTVAGLSAGPADTPPSGVLPPAVSFEPATPFLGSTAPDTEARAAYAEALLSQLQAQMAELEARLHGSQAMLKEARLRLGQADAELVRMRLQVRELADRKETEMGRLESGAIAVLESTIATHREQVAKLEEKLGAVRATAEEHVHELAVERRRCAQLQSALAERDQHIATLMSKRAQERAAAPDSGFGR